MAVPFWPQRYRTFNSRRIGLALAVGLMGGLVFSYLSTPMPFMLGPLFACLVAALATAPVASPMALRPPMTAMIGVMMGAGYSPGVLAHISSWAMSLFGLLVFMVVAGAASVAYFRYVARYDFATAYFAGMPGGLVEMVVIGEQSGADMRKVALAHAGRIVFTVFTVPFIVQWIEGPIDRAIAADVSLLDMDIAAYLWLTVCVLGGLILGRFVKLPAPYLLGPMAVSVVVHITGWSSFKPPWELIVAAQLVLGTAIGCRFAGSRTQEVLRSLVVSLGATLLLVCLSLGFAWAVAQLSDYSVTELLLAYSPGGLAEMGLLALGLQLEVALVSTHHLVRIMLVVLGATLLMPLFGIKRRMQ